MRSRVRRIAWIAGLTTMLASTGAAAQDPHALDLQHTSNSLTRIFATENSKLDIDGMDDVRVDVDIAVLDSGVDVEHPDLNVVKRVDCTATVGYDCEVGPNMADDDHSHGTGGASVAAAIDNGFGGVGVAPGARLWAIDIHGPGAFGTPPEDPIDPPAAPIMDIDAAIAGVEWVTAHADEIEVAELAFICSPDEEAAEPHCPNAAKREALEDAIDASIDAGVVYVVGAGGGILGPSVPGTDMSALVPQSLSDVITVSGMSEFDGAPGGIWREPICKAFGSANPADDGQNETTEDKDDTLANISNWGAGVDVVAPSSCIGMAYFVGFPHFPAGTFYVIPQGRGESATSGAFPHVVGAAALLASRSNPNSRLDVVDIRDEIHDAGNLDWIDDGGPNKTGDNHHERLLDVGDEAVFDPVTVGGEEGGESDVNGDGRSDLVTLSPDGVGRVFGGGDGGPFGSGVESFRDQQGNGTLDPAQFDGDGHYVVDVADVDGNGRADQVTLSDDGDVHVFPGRADSTFGADVVSSLDLPPALLEPGGHEPIAVADVDGDGRGDLVSHDDRSDAVSVYRGDSDATFGAAVTARSGIQSAAHGGGGVHFVGVADVTGDGLADLVSMNTWKDLYVYAGQDDGTFADPTSSQWGDIDPAMDDAKGFEPVGLDDVTGDSQADLVLLKAGTVYVYAGLDNGEFDDPVDSLAGALLSTTFGGNAGFEAATVMDVTGDGHADLVTAYTNATAYVFRGHSSGVFFGYDFAESLNGSLKSTQHRRNQDATGRQIVVEKPSWRRNGCSYVGCNPSGDRVGIWRQSDNGWWLRNWDMTLDPQLMQFEYGVSGAPQSDLPVVGDWDGDGIDTVGVWRREGQFATFLLRNSNSPGSASQSLVYGIDEAPYNDLPVVGDWDGDGDDTVGVWRREGQFATFILRNSNSPGGPAWDELVTFGIDEAPYNDLPVVGDWDGDGDDTVGVWRRSDNTWYLADGSGFVSFQYGSSQAPQNDLPVVGDWDGDGDDTVGVWRREGQYARFLLRNSNTAGAPDYEVTWGIDEAPSNDLPVIGKWGGG